MHIVVVHQDCGVLVVQPAHGLLLRCLPRVLFTILWLSGIGGEECSRAQLADLGGGKDDRWVWRVDELGMRRGMPHERCGGRGSSRLHRARQAELGSQVDMVRLLEVGLRHRHIEVPQRYEGELIDGDLVLAHKGTVDA